MEKATKIALVKTAQKPTGLSVKTCVKAGIGPMNCSHLKHK
jgi:hypothetical protein